MLVFTRRVGETVVIDGNIRVTLLGTQGGKIRLGIAAPDSVCVDREEVHARRVQGELPEWCAGWNADSGEHERIVVPAFV